MAVSDQEVMNFLDVGNGYGDGDGYGNGYGDGDGYGNGSGDGYGYGYGYGNGYGDGDGYGYGYGNSYGDGDGNGDGNGYGYGIKEINGMTVHLVDGLPTIITSVRGSLASGYMLKRNVHLVPCYVARTGNYFGHGTTSHEAMAAAREKYEENRPLDDRIDSFISEFPSLDSEGTGRQFYLWHHILTGSCAFGRDQFCEAHGVDLDRKYTVSYFLDLVKNDYGSDAIRQTRERYY